MHEEAGARRGLRRPGSGDAVAALVLVACGALGLGVGFVIGMDQDPYGASDWVLVALVVTGVALLVLGPLAVRLRRRRRRRSR